MSTTTADFKNSPSPSPERVAPIMKLAWVGPLGGVIAAIANVLVYLIAKPLAGGELYNQMGPTAPVQALPLVAVILSSFVPSIFAALLYAGLGRFAPRPITVFTILAIVFGLLSLGAPLSLNVEVASRVALAAMHIVAGVAITGTLITLGRAK